MSAEGSSSRSSRPARPRARLTFAMAAVSVGLSLASPYGPSTAAASAPPDPQSLDDTALSDFSADGTAAVVGFKVSYPKAVLALVISGGAIESISQADGLGRSQAIAGPFPVPAATSAALLVGPTVPGTDIPIPDGVRRALTSVDFQALPNYCQSQYPGPGGKDVEKYCGGPLLGGPKEGAEGAALNGVAEARGDASEPLRATSKAVSRGGELRIFGFQTAIRNGSAATTSGINENGQSQGWAKSVADEISLLAGVVKISGLHAEALAVSNGRKDGVAWKTSFSFREASVVGIPVRIDSGGVSVDAQRVPADELSSQSDKLEDQLKALDLQIRLVPASPARVDGPRVEVESAGIEIVHQGSTLTAANSVYHLGLARAGASGLATGGPEEAGPAAAAAGGASEDGSPDMSDAPLAGAEPAGTVAENPVAYLVADDRAPSSGQTDSGLTSSSSDEESPLGTRSGELQSPNDLDSAAGVDPERPAELALGRRLSNQSPFEPGRLRTSFAAVALVIVAASASMWLRSLIGSKS